MENRTFENITLRNGYSKGQNPMGMRWNLNTRVILEKTKGPYGNPRVKLIASDGMNLKMESNTICCWRDNSCVLNTRKNYKFNLQYKMANMIGKKPKPYRIDLMNKFGDIIVSFSAPDQKTYDDMCAILKSMIGPSKCHVEDTKAEKQRKQHLVGLTSRKSRLGGRRKKKMRKHKKRKTKKRHKTKKRRKRMKNKRKRNHKTKRRR